VQVGYLQLVEAYNVIEQRQQSFLIIRWCGIYKFVANLGEQSKIVQAADAVSAVVEFEYFDPARFECSVSV
jgi:hypothetical protein